MPDSIRKSLERKMFYIVAILVASNAYFVQRVIACVDQTTAEVSAVKEHIARIETKIDDMRSVQQSRWKKL